MKLTVITDAAGSVLGTLSHSGAADGGAGQLVAGPGQIAHQVELTEAMSGAESPDVLHRMVADHLARSRG